MDKLALGRQFSWALAGRVGATALTLAALVLLSRLLGPAEFGRLALAQAAVITVDSVLFYWLVASITRLSPEQGRDLPAFRGAILIGYALSGMAATGVAVAGIAIGAQLGLDRMAPLGFATLAAVFGEALFARGLEHLRAFSRSGPYAFSLFLRGLLTLGLAVAGLLAFGFRAEAALVGHAAGCLAAAAVTEAGWPATIRIEASWRRHIAAIWRYGYPLSLSVIFRMLIQRLDRFVIGGVLGAEAAGLYALAFDFARRALALPLLVVSVVTYPAMVQAWSRDDAAETFALARLNWFGLLAIGLPGACGLGLVAGDSLRLLFGPEYVVGPGSTIAAVAAFCMLIEAIRLHHLDVSFMLRQDNRAQILINGVGCLGNAVACLTLIPVYGTLGAAVIALVTLAMLAVLSSVLGRSDLAMPTPLSPVLGIVLSCAIMAASVWLLGDADNLPELLVRLAVGAIVFFGAMIGFDLAQCRQMLGQVFRSRADPE